MEDMSFVVGKILLGKNKTDLNIIQLIILILIVFYAMKVEHRHRPAFIGKMKLIVIYIYI